MPFCTRLGTLLGRSRVVSLSLRSYRRAIAFVAVVANINATKIRAISRSGIPNLLGYGQCMMLAYIVQTVRRTESASKMTVLGGH